jgi:hypothetical protein
VIYIFFDGLARRFGKREAQDQDTGEAQPAGEA